MNKQNNKNKPTGKSNLFMWIVIFVVMAFAAAGGGEAGFAAIVAVILATVILLISAVSNKKRASKTGDARPAPKGTPRAFRHPEDPKEEAIHCGHLRGKEKYIQQLDGYLKAGLIDKAEYRVMRERYEKLELPEDYH